ncbi:MAG: hypothetical protein IAG13_04970 [Deltaproteobacteria bacterium]|nr:hypothetical protein [Nannocystaceae bacterium]
MFRSPRSPSVSLSLVLVLAACATKPDATVQPPAPARERPEEGSTYVSTSHNESGADAKRFAPVTTPAGDFVVTTPEAAKELAERAIAEYLDPKKTWKTSPVLPAGWPAKERAVIVFFYPMSANPNSMTHYQLFTPSYYVKVSLADGTTAIEPIAKHRELGSIEDTRPSSLERRELDIAEASLVQQLTGTTIDDGDQPYWGYLKYIHEHPQLGRDLERRAPAFLGWVRKKYGHASRK